MVQTLNMNFGSDYNSLLAKVNKYSDPKKFTMDNSTMDDDEISNNLLWTILNG